MLLISLSLLAVAMILGALEYRAWRRDKRMRDAVSEQWLREYWRNPK